MRRTLALFVIVFALAPVAAAQASEVKVASGVLTYTDPSPADRNIVTVTPTASSLTVTESGATTGGARIAVTSDGSCTLRTASRTRTTTATCPLAGVSAIELRLGDQDDTGTIASATAIAARLFGEGGNDKLTGGGADDLLDGGAGGDTLGGGAGRDTADYSARTGPVAVSLNGSPDDGEGGEKDNVASDVENLVGGSADDQLAGNDGDNALLGNAGNDILGGGGGNDQLDGGAGDDTLAGGTGSDSIVGGDGADTASYAESDAGVRVVLDGKPGDGANGENDSVDTENATGSGHDDTLIGNGGANTIAGGGGNDRILGGRGVDALDGGLGDDILQSLDGETETVACGDGEDGVVSDRRDVRTDCDYIKYRAVAASATALHLSNGAVRAPVRCSPATAEGCRGRISLKAGRTTLGTLTYNLTSGRRWVAKIKLSRKGKRYVSKRRVTTASLVVRNVDATGDAVRTTQTIRIGH
jgi:Ca2+-binding RTX toxin-like protein